MNSTLDEFVSEEPYALEKIGEVAAKIAYYNFDWRYVTLVMFNSLQYTLALTSFLKHYKQSVVLRLGRFIPHYRFSVPQFIIFGQDSYEIIETIMWLDKANYNNAGKYVILCTSDNYEKCDETQIFSILVSVKIINVIYMRGETFDKFSSFSYDIVLPNKCLNSEPYSVDFYNNCTNDDCFKTVFPEKLNNFYKCPFTISTFEQPPFMRLANDTLEPSGGDGDILKMVANALNASLIIKIPVEGNDWGHYENGNWTGSLGDVFNDRVHASVCSLPLTDNMYGNFQISFVYNSMDIVWTAQLPALKPAWQKLLNPLQMNLRIALFFSFMTIVLCNYVMKSKIWQRIRKMFRIGPTKVSLIFYAWTLFLGVPIIKMPTNHSFQVIVFSWIWFCFVMKNAYQAALMNSLKKNDYEDSFSSFDVVLKAKLPYGGPTILRDYYADDEYIYDKWVSMEFDDAYAMLDQISNGSTNLVLAFNKEIIIEHLIEYSGERHLQILPEKIVNSPTVMYFKKHSVLTPPVNDVLSILVEAGFTQLTYRKYLSHKKLLFQITNDKKNRPLTFDNLKACMFFLIFGWFLSLIFFIAEAYCGRIEED